MARSPEMHWSPRLGLVLVALAYLVAQLALFSLDRAPSWDEAVYLSQVTPDAEATVFAPSRTRGIVVLVAPFTFAGVPLTGVRVALAVLSSIGLAAAFGAWVAGLKGAAPLAAAIFGASWLTLFYGSEAMPNLWTALLGVAATGLFVSALEGRPRAHLVAAAALAGMAFMRPPDAVVLLIVLLVWAAIRRASLRVSAALVGGVIVGATPWAIELLVRFGDPIEALRTAGDLAHLETGSFLERTRQYLALGDGPTLGPQARPDASIFVLVSLGVFLTMSMWAAVDGIRTRRPAPVVAATAGWVLVLGYVVLVSGLAPRFLMPGLALLSVAGAWAWAHRPQVARTAVVHVGAVAVFGAWIAWQAVVANDIEATVGNQREVFRQAGRVLRDVADDDPCSFRSEGGFPQIQLYSRCRGGGLTGNQPSARFLVVPGSTALPPTFSVVGSVPGSSGDTWVVATEA